MNAAADKEVVYKKLSDELIEKIQVAYPQEKAKSIRSRLADLTDDDDCFVEGGFAEVKKRFPDAFPAANKLKGNKIDNAGKKIRKVRMRPGKYDELKTLWETINRKAILQYRFEDEEDFATLFYLYLLEKADKFTATGVRTVQKEIRVQNNLLSSVRQSSVHEAFFEPICTMDYREFLLKLSQAALIKMETLHQAFYRARHKFDISRFLNEQTIHIIKSGFNRYLLQKSFSEFQVVYARIGGGVHPTKFTDKAGTPLAEVNTVDLGVLSDESSSPLQQYLFDSVFFDSELEQENITHDGVSEVVVFTKIPKNSIKIPVAGGESYSPDFAYIVKTAQGDVLNFVLETKNVADDTALRQEEAQKIKHAEKLFAAISDEMKVVFQTQFAGDKVADLLRKYI